MSQDNWNASVQNKQHDGALHSESADSNKNQAYTPSSGVPPNYASNGSMVDGVQSNMSENLAAGHNMTMDPVNVNQQTNDAMQYHQRPMTPINSMPYLIPSGPPLITPALAGSAQAQMPHGHVVPIPPGYTAQDPNVAQQQMLLPGAMHSSSPLLLPQGLMLSNPNAPMQLQGQMHHAQQQMLPMQVPGGQMYSQAPAGTTQAYPAQGDNLNRPMMTKPWHSPEQDAPIRQHIAEQIVLLLQQRRPNATEDWQQKLPNMGKRLEDALYLKANSLDEYRDSNTLKQRLQLLAQQMNSKNTGPVNRAPGTQQPMQPGMVQPGATQTGAVPPSGAQQQQQYQGQGQGPQVQVPQIPPYVQQQLLPQPQQGTQQPQQAPQPQAGQTSRTLAAVSSQYPTGPPVYRGGGMPAGMAPALNTPVSIGNGMNAIEGLNMQQATQVDQSPSQAQNLSLPTVASPTESETGPMSSSQADTEQIIDVMVEAQNALGGTDEHGGAMGKRPTSQHSEEHRRQVLKQQQQRLLLLRHASKCPHENGRCPVTPHCASMKNLWKHIMGCKDQECKIPHCVSSRYVLSHYSKCKDVNCPVCGPVREAIRRNYQKSQLIIDMSNKPQGAGVSEAGEKRPRASMAADKSSIVLPADKKPRLVPEAKPSAQRANNLLDPISCALYSFTNDQIKAHIQNIQEGMRLSAAGIRDLCVPIVEELYKVPHAYVIFSSPVDPVLMGLNDYFDIIKAPMDLGTIKKRLDMNGYRDINNFAFDVRLTFQNAMRYNPKNSDVYVLSKQLLRDFDAKFAKVVHHHEISMEEKRANNDACLVCGEISLKFEPPVYYCNGRCGGQRIRRNSYFYSAGNNAYHWCTICFSELKEGQLIQLPDCTITKAELAKNKKKHSEESEEPWVQCDTCERWVHQICGLFNGRRNLGDSVSYMCPNCLIEKRKSGSDNFMSTTTKKMQAIDLPRTTLSDFIERRVAEQLEKSYRETSFKLNQTMDEVEKCPALILRQVSCFDKNQTTREAMLERYKSKNYPAEFPCRTKCLVLFQNIDGQDTLLFGMYVYEYGHNCPQPNQRRCYVSYLDSVHYFRPKQYRTVVYHEILVAYLEYMKARGFHTAHIWACPPLKGDDYILYCHPTDQKTPKDDKLRKWYVDMLDICKQRGIMTEVTDIYTEYLADASLDATALPYFEGDYWVSEAEVIIRDLGNNPTAAITESVVEESEDATKKKSGTTKKRTRSARAGGPPSASSVSRIDRDPVMAKLGSVLEPMKEAFFVARMHPKEFAQTYADKLQAELEAAHTQQSVANDKKRDEELQAEALSGSNDNYIRSDVPKSGESGGKGVVVASNAGAAPVDKSVIESKDDAEEAPAQESVKATPSVVSSAMRPTVSDAKHAKPWHSADHESHRQAMIENIIKIRRARTPGAPEESFIGLTDEVKKQENILYLHAASLEDYLNPETLRTRMNQVETHMATHVGGAGGGVAGSEAIKLTWQKPGENIDARREITTLIIEMLKSKGTATNEEWLRSLPEKAKRLEVGLYTSAANLEDYSNKATLKFRLQTLAKNISAPKPEVKEESVAATSAPVTSSEEPTPAAAPKVEAKAEPTLLPNGLPKFKDDTEDVDDIQENEHFDTRQSFLNLCQGNHYQFDQLRRAKHTSMMVLYLLHNPDAPKFVPSCSNCHKDILVGNKHHCESCDIDFCDECCNLNGLRIHMHPLRTIALATSAPPKQFTEEQRRERQRSIALHLQLLSHASTCTVDNCPSKNCLKMKEFLKHGLTCKITVKKGCPVCKRILNLLQLHARSCKLEKCSVPKCREIREHQKMQNMRQQAMDDRRRAMMNEMYSRPGGVAAPVVEAEEPAPEAEAEN